MIDRRALIDAAEELETLALKLGGDESSSSEAIEGLLRAADGNLAALRRAHRRCERAVSEEWPATRERLRAFFYLSAARRQAETYKVD
ncbi:MAG: hypothetical protein ACRDKZ_01535 [Actinomycetota bacterium]